MSDNAPEKEVSLNGQKMTEDQFKDKKQDLEKKPGVNVVETGDKQYRTRIKG